MGPFRHCRAEKGKWKQVVEGGGERLRASGGQVKHEWDWRGGNVAAGRDMSRSCNDLATPAVTVATASAV